MKWIRQRLRENKGFILVEVIWAVVIISLLLSLLGVPTTLLRRWEENRLERVGYEVLWQLEEIQQQTMLGYVHDSDATPLLRIDAKGSRIYQELQQRGDPVIFPAGITTGKNLYTISFYATGLPYGRDTKIVLKDTVYGREFIIYVAIQTGRMRVEYKKV